MPSEVSASEYPSLLTSVGEAGLWNEKGRIRAHKERLTVASREVRKGSLPLYPHPQYNLEG